MPQIEIISFEETIEDSARFTRRHLLLGNGFSIACKPDIFQYNSLFEQADFSKSPRLKNVFDAVGTTDFERVIKMLEDASRIVSLYSEEDDKAPAQMQDDARRLKDILIRTIACNHPDVPNDIPDEKFRACRRFLSHFLGKGNNGGKVYTLNYDLLLYWALMHDDPEGEELDLETNDGFGRDGSEQEDYVVWLGESSAHHQRVHYLHGALHLFDAGAELQKYTWINTGVPLLEQARNAMDQNKFPLFVAEGDSEQKLEKIHHSSYLHHSYKSFSAQMNQRNQSLFIFGHSLAENDQHVLKKIEQGRVPQIYVGLYGDSGSENNRHIIAAAYALSERRDDQNPLAVSFFDAASANVWEDAS